MLDDDPYTRAVDDLRHVVPAATMVAGAWATYMAPLHLYWRRGAAAMAPHAALAEIGLDYELIEIDRGAAQSSPAYRALNPLGVVPTLVDGDEVLTEAAAIMLTLAERHPEARLVPADTTRYYRWLVFMQRTRCRPAFLRFFYRSATAPTA